MSSDLAIRVEGLSKAYVVRHKAHDHVTLAQSALERIEHPFRRDEREEFWALHDVSFEVKQGEAVGIIGRNGAGKSTLLKLLTRITGPTAGRIDLWGRVGSLLEVGTGFHPELTGRENVYLNGSILGMRRREIDQQFDTIVEFAGVEKFLDTPVKRYSSGMYVRLAFAVAAHLRTEILLLDEVLAVGDADFQRKCLAKLRDLATDGRTVLLVSHQPTAIAELTQSAIWLDRGSLRAFGPTAHVQLQYVSSADGQSGLRPLEANDRLRGDFLSHDVEVTAMGVAATEVRMGQGESLTIDLELVGHARVDAFRLQLGIHDDDRKCVGCTFTDVPLSIVRGERVQLRLETNGLRLSPGRYSLTLSVGQGDHFSTVEEYDVVMNGGSFRIEPPVRGDGAIGDKWQPQWGRILFEPLRVNVLSRSGPATD